MIITPEVVLQAYAQGLFPMAPSHDSDELDWYEAEKRGVIPLFKPHIPRRLLKTVLTGRYNVFTNRNFKDVIKACALRREGRDETWISPKIDSLYCALHELGYAHSVEVLNEKGDFVGGLYGVALGGAFFGESMVSFERDTSKIALIHLIAALREGGYRLLDTQFVTPHLATMGCIEIDRSSYHSLLRQALEIEATWPEDISLKALKRPILELRNQSKGAV
ncbi:leucyl/phenylalanyl-tRNA--protein transferase [Aristophania vespae]|nr:Leucyl/phenylalanyl-tRNA--protein transferase [Aristophania vespae]